MKRIFVCTFLLGLATGCVTQTCEQRGPKRPKGFNLSLGHFDEDRDDQSGPCGDELPLVPQVPEVLYDSSMEVPSPRYGDEPTSPFMARNGKFRPPSIAVPGRFKYDEGNIRPVASEEGIYGDRERVTPKNADPEEGQEFPVVSPLVAERSSRRISWADDSGRDLAVGLTPVLSEEDLAAENEERKNYIREIMANKGVFRPDQDPEDEPKTCAMVADDNDGEVFDPLARPDLDAIVGYRDYVEAVV